MEKEDCSHRNPGSSSGLNHLEQVVYSHQAASLLGKPGASFPTQPTSLRSACRQTTPLCILCPVLRLPPHTGRPLAMDGCSQGRKSQRLHREVEGSGRTRAP